MRVNASPFSCEADVVELARTIVLREAGVFELARACFSREADVADLVRAWARANTNTNHTSPAPWNHDRPIAMLHTCPKTLPSNTLLVEKEQRP